MKIKGLLTKPTVSESDLLLRKVARGDFASEAEIAAELTKIQPEPDELTSSIEIPPYRVGAMPLRDELEVPLITARDEVGNTRTQYLPALQSFVTNSHNWKLTSITGLDVELQRAQSLVTELQLTTSDSERGFIWISDTLQTTDRVDSSQTSCQVLNGQANLSVTGHQNLNGAIATITIDKAASRGIPGNHTTISNSTTPNTTASIDTEPTVELVADKDPHANITYMLDDTPTSWFEWESVHVPRKQKVKKVGAALVTDPSGSEMDIYNATGGKGWGWTKYIQWPGETTWDTGVDNQGVFLVDFDKQNAARLVLTLALKDRTQISYLQLTPLLQGGVYPVVRSLQSSLDNINWVTIAKDVYLSEKLNESLLAKRIGVPDGNYSGIGIWNMGDRFIQYIRLTLETTGSYTPEHKLGHKFYYEVLQKHKSGGWLTKGKDWTETKRLANPPTGVDAGYNPGNASVIGGIIGGIAATLIPGGKLLTGFGIGSSLGQSLFGGAVTTTISDQGEATDILAGTRSAIAIRDFEIARRTYSADGQLMTAALRFASQVRAVSLITTEEIPGDWGAEKQWLTYFISADGIDWHEIVPLNRSGGSKDVVEFTTDKVYLKVLMTRPDGREGETPVLKSYAIKGLPV